MCSTMLFLASLDSEGLATSPNGRSLAAFSYGTEPAIQLRGGEGLPDSCGRRTELRQGQRRLNAVWAFLAHLNRPLT